MEWDGFCVTDELSHNFVKRASERFAVGTFSPIRLHAHYANLKLTTVYRRSRLQSSTRVTLDDYVYFKIERLVTKSVEWEMRWKINDTDAINGDTFPKEFYAQLQLWSWHSISGRVRYTQSRFGSSSRTQPNPKHRTFVRVEYKW